MENIHRSLVVRSLWLIIPTVFLALLSPVPFLGLEANLVEEYFIFQLNDKKGVRNSNDKILIPAEYEDLGWSIGEFHPLNEVLGFKENGRWGLITLKNKKIGPATYINLYPLNRQLIVASKVIAESLEERYGIIDLKGNIVLGFEYGPLSLFNNLVVASIKKDSGWKFGVMNSKFQQVLPFRYDQIRPLNNQFAVVKESEMYGLMDASGKMVIQPKYHIIELNGREFKGKLFNTYEIRNARNQMLGSYQLKDLRKADNGVLVATGMDETLLLNTQGQVIKSLPHTEVFEFKHGRAITKLDGKYGVINTVGETLIPNNNKSIWISEDYIGIEVESNSWKLINPALSEISLKDYQHIKPATNGLFAIKRHDSWGFIDDNGIEVIPPHYQEVENFEGNVALANYLGSWGLINTEGNWLIKPRFTKLEKITNDVYLFETGNRYGLANTNQEIVYQTSNILRASKTGAIEQDFENLYGLISLDGEQMLSVNYRKVSPFAEDPNYYQFEDENGKGIFNISKRTFTRDSAIQEMRTLDDGYIGVRINDQYGFIDLNGKLRIANRYENIGVFSEDMSPVKIRGKWGYVDRLERLKVQPMYETVDDFTGGLAIVSRNKKYGLIDKSGQAILRLNYDGLERLVDGQFIFRQGKKAGLVDSSGKVLLYPEYSSLETFENGLLKTLKNGKNGLINNQGKKLIPAIYDEINYDQKNDLYILTKKYSWEVIKL